MTFLMQPKFSASQCFNDSGGACEPSVQKTTFLTNPPAGALACSLLQAAWSLTLAGKQL